MPKLNQEAAEQVNQAEGTGDSLIEEGTYPMVLMSVESHGSDGQPLTGEKGPYWKWTFAFPEDAPRYKNWKQWANTSLSTEAMPIMKQYFDAFGVSADTDTDELVGKQVLVQVSKRTVQKGVKAGEIRNFIRTVFPLDHGTASGSTESAGKAKAKKDLF